MQHTTRKLFRLSNRKFVFSSLALLSMWKIWNYIIHLEKQFRETFRETIKTIAIQKRQINLHKPRDLRLEHLKIQYTAVVCLMLCANESEKTYIRHASTGCFTLCNPLGTGKSRDRNQSVGNKYKILNKTNTFSTDTSSLVVNQRLCVIENFAKSQYILCCEFATCVYVDFKYAGAQIVPKYLPVCKLICKYLVLHLGRLKNDFKCSSQSVGSSQTRKDPGRGH